MTLAENPWPTYTAAALDNVHREPPVIKRECRAFQQFRQRVQAIEP